LYKLNTGFGAARPMAAALMNLGTVLLLRQSDEEAATVWAEAARQWEQLGSPDEVAYCQLGEAAVRLDQKIGQLSAAGHAATDPGEMRRAAREMVTLYPDLIAMYEKIGATQLVAEFCASAASTANFVGDSGRAVAWYRQAAKAFQAIGIPGRARQALVQGENLLRRGSNDLLQKKEMAAALPWLLQLADVAEELGDDDIRATAMLNSAICLLQVSQDFNGARTLAENSLPLFAANSDDAAMAQKIIAYCAGHLKSG
jgi:hypothetical protein